MRSLAVLLGQHKNIFRELFIADMRVGMGSIASLSIKVLPASGCP